MGPAPRLEQRVALEAQEAMGIPWVIRDVVTVSLAQGWPGTAGTHLGHPSLVPHRPAEDGEVTSRWPKQGQAGLALQQGAGTGTGRGGCAGTATALLLLGVMGGPDPAPGRGKDVGMGNEGYFPVLAGAGSLCGPGAAGQGEKENSDSSRRETGAAGGQRSPGFPEGPGSQRRGRGKEHTHHTPVSSSAPSPGTHIPWEAFCAAQIPKEPNWIYPQGVFIEGLRLLGEEFLGKTTVWL